MSFLSNIIHFSWHKRNSFHSRKCKIGSISEFSKLLVNSSQCRNFNSLLQQFLLKFREIDPSWYTTCYYSTVCSRNTFHVRVKSCFFHIVCKIHYALCIYPFKDNQNWINILWNSRVSSFVIQPNIAHLKRSITTTDSYNLETTTFGYDENIEETTVFAMENQNKTGYQILTVLSNKY